MIVLYNESVAVVFRVKNRFTRLQDFRFVSSNDTYFLRQIILELSKKNMNLSQFNSCSDGLSTIRDTSPFEPLFGGYQGGAMLIRCELTLGK